MELGPLPPVLFWIDEAASLHAVEMLSSVRMQDAMTIGAQWISFSPPAPPTPISLEKIMAEVELPEPPPRNRAERRAWRHDHR